MVFYSDGMLVHFPMYWIKKGCFILSGVVNLFSSRIIYCAYVYICNNAVIRGNTLTNNFVFYHLQVKIHIC